MKNTNWLKRCKRCKENKKLIDFPYCSLRKDNRWNICFNCINKKKSTYKLPQSKAPPKKIWKKTVKRIKENWSESKMFEEIKEERFWFIWYGVSDLSWKTILFDDIWNFCFAHILAKWKYSKYRYYKNNIAFVVSIEEHDEIDKIFRDEIIRKQVEELLEKWKKIDIQYFKNLFDKSKKTDNI